MGRWAQVKFGRPRFDQLGFVLAGTNVRQIEIAALACFDSVEHSAEGVAHFHLVKQGKYTHPLVTNVYGAPAMVDVLAEMHDGGLRSVIFIGYAYGGFKNLPIGSIVLANRAYHFDRMYHTGMPDRKWDEADPQLLSKVKRVLEASGIPYTVGRNISVPAVTYQYPHNNPIYKEIDPLTVEMELAACYSRAKDLGVRAAGILIVSDNKKGHLRDIAKIKARSAAKLRLLKTIAEGSGRLRLPALRVGKRFDPDEFMAAVIETPEQKTNVYKDLSKQKKLWS